ncbi:MAG: HAMP domain-containing histidine kinase [Gemmatimonadaceae bacterium]|nr:HAMP domain-containing histidine kinase [Gemmatimonadaceae bacterium]NUO95320.1 HAMP domain-containing histidine kinase [Gemmatimonadaceae bacterium]NUP55105.1 HAMP domain-containing histidine kinase [Gemmatimonadaceae bacterium]NUP70906.1 HAMP domain-containing histidine kinase [Gemmatimonadaceae bacterium]NUR33378.1 HAMP domain-containing histidine kinase [Gemmatimonadaceae bacterium]
MKPVGFRARLFLILLGFALIPTVVLAAAWELTVVRALPLLGTTPAMERIAGTGARAAEAVRTAPLTSEQRALLDEHERALTEGLLRARQMEFLMTRRAPVAAGLVALAAALLMGLVASRVAGHLSRNLSRPLSELVGWTATISRGEPLPDGPPRKGAPEFVMLRNRMREMATELRLGRVRALEAERATALRESARQVAHELKNPLTPIRFAIARLRREAPPALTETVEVLESESRRLEEMARSFAQFGRLPEGPRAPVDLGELARAATRSAVPGDSPVTVAVDDDVPMVPGHVDALGRALTNVLLNAVDASPPGAPVRVSVRRAALDGRDMVEVAVRDEGCGIPASRISRIWEPYVTHKAGGTGLGLAIVRQTLIAHDGAVAAESAPGMGTTIKLFLPVVAPAATLEMAAHGNG